MDKKSIKSNPEVKRSYKHSDAWIAKHTAKIAAEQEVAKTAKPKKERKQNTKKLDNKKVQKKTPSEKVKSPAKLTLKSADNLFNQIKKHISAVKKSSKLVGKFYTEALKTGDKLYFERVQKIFKRINYTYLPENGTVVFEAVAKVKVPKAKKMKTPNAQLTKIKPAKAETTSKPIEETEIAIDAPVEVQTSRDLKIPVEAAPISELDADEDDANEPTDEELDAIENEEDDEELDDEDAESEIERLEYEDDDDYRERVAEERRMAREMAEADRDAREDIFAAMEENGDFS